MTEDLNWRKAKDSQASDACVEVAGAPDQVHVRDSKNAAGAVLIFGKAAWAAYTATIKAD